MAECDACGCDEEEHGDDGCTGCNECDEFIPAVEEDDE